MVLRVPTVMPDQQGRVVNVLQRNFLGPLLVARRNRPVSKALRARTRQEVATTWDRDQGAGEKRYMDPTD